MAAAYRTGLKVWTAGQFAGFTSDPAGAIATAGDGSLQLIPAVARNESDPWAAGSYSGGHFYTGGSYLVGEATIPEVELPAGPVFTEAIASWNASTPTGAWVEVLLRARYGDRCTKWYNMGVWASDCSTVRRHSVKQQGDADGHVAVDTLILAEKRVRADALQLKVRLFSVNGRAAPSVSLLSLSYSTPAPKKAAATAGGVAPPLDVPRCSQMVYPDGGNVWCSATSTAMILGYYEQSAGDCEPRVRAAVDGVYDWVYDGHGNWPFNTAFAGAAGKISYVARFTGFDQVEQWVRAGIPIALSFSWGKGDLTGAAIPASNGHLAVVVGFDANGNPIVNDPAHGSDAQVRQTYLRSELEPLWLQSSGGAVYIIYPPGHPVPPAD